MANGLFKRNMHMFGLPYQFTKAGDPRFEDISKNIGRKYLQNIYNEGPICTIIPGKPKYLPSKKSKDEKISTTAALLSSAGGFDSLSSYLSNPGKDQRLYDFERDYTSYMSYVNILCRTGATFLELDQTINGVSLKNYDWRNYRSDGNNYQSMTSKIKDQVVKDLKDKINEVTGKDKDSKKEAKKTKAGIDERMSELTGLGGSGKKFLYETIGDSTDAEISAWEEALTNTNYVQFYVDPDIQCNETMSNTTGESMLKSALDTGSNTMKDLAFMMNSGGMSTKGFQEFADSAGNNIGAAIETVTGGGTVSGALSRILNLSGNVIKGENIIMPDIYQSSQLNRSYSLTCHLKAPYGTKFGYYMDIYVPMMHLLALALPKQTTANTYGSPFLVKVYVDGLFNCNLGLVTGITIQKMTESRTLDGLPTEVDVTLEITDLYSDLTMSPQSDPMLFINNASLVEYLATNCGLSLIAPNASAKYGMMLNTMSNSFGDIGTNIASNVNEKIDNMMTSFMGLTSR